MNTPIYVATPDELVSTIPAIEGSIRFSGNNTKIVTPDEMRFAIKIYSIPNSL